MLLLAMALACLTVAAPRQCAALAISKGLPFYAQDMEFYYQHHRVDALPGILRTFDSQGVLNDSLKQLMLAAFLGQVLRDPTARQRLLPPPETLSRDGRRTLAWAAHFANYPMNRPCLPACCSPLRACCSTRFATAPAP